MNGKLYKNLIGVVAVLFVMWLLMYIGNRNNDRIIANGVYTILTVAKINHSTYYGYNVSYRYEYGGIGYAKESVFDDVDDNSMGKRYFLVIDKDYPHNYLVLRTVPSWFTLEAPPEGWKEKPTEVEMREMMKQDSVNRKLK